MSEPLKSVDVMCSASWAMSSALRLAQLLDQLRNSAEYAMCEDQEEFSGSELLEHGGEIMHVAEHLSEGLEKVRKMIVESAKNMPKFELVKGSAEQPSAVADPIVIEGREDPPDIPDEGKDQEDFEEIMQIDEHGNIYKPSNASKTL